MDQSWSRKTKKWHFSIWKIDPDTLFENPFVLFLILHNNTVCTPLLIIIKIYFSIKSKNYFWIYLIWKYIFWLLSKTQCIFLLQDQAPVILARLYGIYIYINISYSFKFARVPTLNFTLKQMKISCLNMRLNLLKNTNGIQKNLHRLCTLNFNTNRI